MLKVRKLELSKSIGASGIGFIFTLATATIVSILSIYLYQEFGLTKSQIGFFGIFFTILTMIISFGISPLFKKYEERTLIIVSLLSLIILYAFLGFVETFWFFCLVYILITFFRILRNYSFSIFYRDLDKNIPLYKKEGYYFTLFNIAWFLAPFIISIFLLRLDLNILFIIASSLLLLGLVMYLFFPITKKEEHSYHKKKTQNKVITNVKSFFSEKNNRILFLLSMGPQIWWAFIYSFMPILILEQGFNSSIVALFLALVIVPSIMAEFKFSSLTTKYHFSHLFVFAYFLMTLTALIAFLSNNILFALIILIIGSFSNAIIEPAREIYFFKKTPQEKERDWYAIFSTYNPFGYIIGMTVFSIFFLTNIPTHYVYLLLAFLMTFLMTQIIKLEFIQPPYFTR